MSATVLCEGLSNCGREFGGDQHDALSRVFEDGFVLCNCRFLGLLPVMRDHPPCRAADVVDPSHHTGLLHEEAAVDQQRLPGHVA